MRAILKVDFFGFVLHHALPDFDGQ